MNIHPANRLKGEKSPYLARHSLNPIQWFPWCKEAFAEAERRDCPIFLSVGYSTCHWCSIMEKESFENDEIAKIINSAFVSIKVDREELPHIDEMYMEFAGSLLSGGGGWPLNLFLTPELKPFFAFCYVPPTTSLGLMGLKEIALHIQSIWNGADKEIVFQQADTIVHIFEDTVQSLGLEIPNEQVYEDGVGQFFEVADPVFGGLQGGPKFPMTYQLEMLMNYSYASEDPRALYFVDLTLNKMALGGLRDQIGGGFSRYTVDAKWSIPHFEKLLIDNALLAKTYGLASIASKNDEYKRVAIETLTYIQEKLRGNKGEFFSGESAEIEGIEGLFYTWSKEEIEEVLPGIDGLVLMQHFSVLPNGNFEGRNVLFQGQTFKQLAISFALEEENVREIIDIGKKALYKKRSTRKMPFKDDKSIVSSSARAIEAFATCGYLFDLEEFKQIALEGASFIYEKMYVDGKILRRHKDGEARFDGILEDYAYLISALLTLFECDMGVKFILWAIELTEMVEILFKSEDGAFYQTEEGSTPHFQRCDLLDGAEPSGNGVHLENLLRLYQITSEDDYLHQAEDILKAAKDSLVAHSPGCGYLLMGLGRFLDSKGETLYIALNEKEEMYDELYTFLRTTFFPHRVVVWLRGKDAATFRLEEMAAIEGETTLYLCRHGNCSKPLIGAEEIRAKFLKNSV
jgi:uncharacterized protein YyaL (SSP411 family)